MNSSNKNIFPASTDTNDPQAYPLEPRIELEYAGFWLRTAAFLFDIAITTLAGLGFAIILFILNVPIPQIISDLLPLLIFWLYFSLMESSARQATIGKTILGIAVTGVNGDKISFWQATGRTFAKLLSVIVLGIGFLIVAFTKRKQGLHDFISKTLVVKGDNFHFWKSILVSLISIIIIITTLSSYGYFVLWPRIMKAFFTNITVTTEPIRISDVEPQAEHAATKPKEIISISEPEYNALISEPLTGLEGIIVGPAILNLSKFWKGEKPVVWIAVMLPKLPNFNFNRRLTKITINNVQSKNGQELYDQRSEFETPFFHSFTVSARDYPTEHLTGIRSVRLIPGTVENDIMSINGKLILSLPIGIKELTFNLTDIGKQKEAEGITVDINAIKDSQILWTYQGDGNHFFDIMAYSEEGQELELNFGMSPSLEENYIKSNQFKSVFKGDIALVKIFIISKIKAHEYPFVLRK